MPPIAKTEARCGVVNMRLTKDGFSSEDELRSANDLQSWSMGDVTVWLEGEGLGHLVEVFKQHRIDGKVLLAMTEGDLRSPPLSLSCLGDIKKISMALDKLRRVHRRTSPDVSPSDTERLYNSSLPPTHTKRNRRNRASSPSPVSRGLANEAKPTRPLSSESRYLADLFKLTMAGLFLMVVSFLTSFTMTVVHERLPDPSLFPPLPDIILDSVPHIPWAFEAAEVLCLMLASTVAIICVFHSFRIAIATRLLAILGAVFLLRCLTMFVTSLSVPGVHLSEPCMAGRKVSMQEGYRSPCSFSLVIACTILSITKSNANPFRIELWRKNSEWLWRLAAAEGCHSKASLLAVTICSADTPLFSRRWRTQSYTIRRRRQLQDDDTHC